MGRTFHISVLHNDLFVDVVFLASLWIEIKVKIRIADVSAVETKAWNVGSIGHSRECIVVKVAQFVVLFVSRLDDGTNARVLCGHEREEREDEGEGEENGCRKNNIFAAILRGGSGRTGVEEEKKGRRQEEKDRRNS